MRITGMMSGMDTDKMIKDMMRVERMRVDKVKQDRQWIEWQQEAYRNLIKQTRSFQSNFLDTLKPASNLKSPNSFAKFSYNITSGGAASSAVTVATSAAAASRSIRIDSIDKLATKDTLVGAVSGARGIKTNSLSDIKADLGTSDLEFNLTIGSVSKAIKLTNAQVAGATTDGDFATLLNSAISSEFGTSYSGLASVNPSGGIKLDMPGVQIRVSQFAENSETLTALGVASGTNNLSFRTQDIGTVLGLTGADLSDVRINGVQINLETTDTFNQMIDKINASGAGIRLDYDALSDRFTLTAQREGTANNMDLAHAGSSDFMTKLFGTGTRTLGQNAELVINGQAVIQGSNTFAFDGISYTLNATHTTGVPIEINTSVNVDAVMDNIKGFVEEYNKLLQSLSSQRTEKRFFDFKPLTDEQRKAMSEDEIKLWEEKAKSGVLSSARELDEMASRLRLSLLEPIEGVNISLRDLGISSSSYLDRGVLTIDEDRLRAQIESNYDEVVKLFSQESSVRYGTGNASQRGRESGLAHRVDDILRDYVRTTRDSSGQKGILVERAGLENDTSFANNILTNRIQSFDSRLEQLERFLASRENYYYAMFARMETALSEMNSQAGKLMSMFGMGGN